MPDDREILETQPASGRPVIAPGYTFGTVTDQISAVVLTKKTPLFWFACFGFGFALLLVFLWASAVLFVKGVGIWGIRSPEMWCIPINLHVCWIVIVHV